MSSSASNINDTFFEGSYKTIWKSLIPAGLTEVETDFVMEVANLKKGDRVLDIMCGYGRHAIDLAKRGVSVTAVDNLKDYIKEIENTAKEQLLPIEPILSGALQVDLSGSYHAAICMGNSFAFFNKEDAVYLLKKVSAHLKPGGILIINSWMIAEIAIKHFRERDWIHVDDYKYLLDYKFLFRPNRIASEQTILAKDGSVEVIKGIDYIFSLDELEEMFQKAGLRTQDLYGSPRKKKFAIGDNRIYIVAEKKK
jgi:ubiquinone/menaquinone biosynthesis C-methylase UbiE